MSFVGLHIHSDYSLLDGASQLPQLVDRAIELEMPAIAVTDHGVMYGAVELIKLCQSKGIKPIIGNEMYVVNGELADQKTRRKKYHQVVLAKNTQGYKNLVKLTTISHLNGFQGKGIFARPCVNKELLEQYHEGLIVTSACLGGEVPQAILQGKYQVAREVAQWYQGIFGEDYYLEIQDHGSIEDRIVNVELIKIAQEFGIKAIATNDSHFISCYDVEAHDALLCINTQKLITDERRMRYSGTEYLKSAVEMAEIFRDHLPDEVIQTAIETTLEVANKVEDYTGILGEPRIPDYPIPENHTPNSYLEEVTWQGLLERLKAEDPVEVSAIYRERLDYELKMIQKMGFSTYFLVVWDYIKYARDHDIPVGPGRGSAAGSLVAYALKITNIDPVHHGLLFERFLNPERKSMPDIDTDFCIERRDEMIQYVTDKYGKDKVAQIITFNRMTSKAVLKDVARVLAIPYGKADQMAKLIPVSRGKPAKLKVMISDETPSPEFKAAYDHEEVPIRNDAGEDVGKVSVRQWIDMAIRIEGTNKTFGVHAAGVVISKEALDEIVPLQHNNDGAVITQYFMEDIEAIGLLKMDFLGLKNLTTIQRSLNYIQQNHNLVIDPYELPASERKTMEILARGTAKKLPEDIQKTYKLLSQGDLEGIFQLESSGMRQIVRDLKPSCIEDLSSILALYRPGPLDAGLIPDFINRKHGREPIKYEHQLLEPILQETYGILVYQEQIMRVAQDLASYSLGEADLLRRAMGKKKVSEMEKHQETFISRAMEKAIRPEIAKSLYDKMVKFAEYCFNKSHSTAYGYVTYITAYLKANYPIEYMAALLTENSGNTDKIQKYIDSCQRGLKIDVVPPNVNLSGFDFTPTAQSIIFGLSAIRNVGEGAIENILQARQEDGSFKDLADFCDRINLQVVNSRALESLIKCGALDSLNPNRQQAIRHLEKLTSWAQAKAKDRAIGQGSIFDLLGGTAVTSQSHGDAPVAPRAEDFTTSEKLQFEKELLGFYVSEHPLQSIVAANADAEVMTLAELSDYKGRGKVKTIVILTAVKLHVTKKGDKMAFLQIEDLTQQLEAIVFPRTYQIVQDQLLESKVVLLIGRIDRSDDREEDKVQIIVETLELIQSESTQSQGALSSSESIQVQPPRAAILENFRENSNKDSSENSNGNLDRNLDRNLDKNPDQNSNQSVQQSDSSSSSKSSRLKLRLSPEKVLKEAQTLNALKAILTEYSGNPDSGKIPIEVVIQGQYHQQTVQLYSHHPQLWIEDSAAVIDRLRDLGVEAEMTQIVIS
ncbi:MAG: DNA polymerase III subunit alpha [Oscillatoriales cyanobacterium RM2_1_1]|nr:DNA polymerase III subunit alpha [Oscillatoriales cyanobacterium RM2_1_1]